MSALSDQDFYTDKQLRERWHCSHMKLYRLRAGSPVRAHVELVDHEPGLLDGDGGSSQVV